MHFYGGHREEKYFTRLLNLRSHDVSAETFCFFLLRIVCINRENTAELIISFFAVLFSAMTRLQCQRWCRERGIAADHNPLTTLQRWV